MADYKSNPSHIAIARLAAKKCGWEAECNVEMNNYLDTDARQLNSKCEKHTEINE